MRHIFVALFLIAPLAHAADVKLSYTAPTTCEDGSALTNCPTTGFEVLTGVAPTGTYTPVETLGPTVTTKTYTSIAPGQKCWSVKTVSGTLKSSESTRSCIDVPSLPPKAPAGITVTVQVTVAVP
jgi:hypothetical protein